MLVKCVCGGQPPTTDEFFHTCETLFSLRNVLKSPTPLFERCPLTFLTRKELLLLEKISSPLIIFQRP